MLKQENCNCSEPLISFSTNGVLNSYNRYTLYRDKWLIHFNSRGYYSRGFLKFLKSLDSCREYGKLKNYLYVVAKNTIRDFQRKKYEITEKLGVEASCDGEIIELVYIVLQSIVKAGITEFFKIDLHIKCYIYLS